MRLFHRHKWKEVEIWTVFIEEDLLKPTYTREKTEAIGYLCSCGKREVKTFYNCGSKCEFHEIHANNQRKVILWLNNAPKKSADVVKLRVVK